MRKVSPSLIVSVCAVVIASTGSATAATLITGKQIKNGSITGRDIRQGSLTGKQVKNHSLTTKDIRPGGVTRAAIADSTATELTATPAQSVVKAEQAVDTYGQVKAVDVSCPDGHVALGGGGEFVQKPLAGRIAYSKPILDEQGIPRGWTVAGQPAGASSDWDARTESLRVYVVCSP